MLRERHAALRGSHREEAKRAQAELLFAAMVVSCEERGFEATSVENLLELSGLSRGTFYAHFDDKLDCFCAAMEEILRMALGITRQRLQGGEGSVQTRARTGLEVFVDLVVSQPAAARLCLIECYPAGERAVTLLRSAIDAIVELGYQGMRQMEFGPGASRELARGIIGGFYQVIYNRIRERREAELPQLVPALWEWSLSYRPVPGPLRGPVRRASRRGVGTLPPFAAFSPEERIIRAFAAVVAAKGYPAATIADVCARASISQSTFYEHFSDKADLMRAALRSSGAQLVAATIPAAKRAPDWPSAVMRAVERTCAFFAAEPDFARLRVIEVYSAGPEAIALRDEVGGEVLRAAVDPLLGQVPELDPVVLEATVGATVGVCYERVRGGDPGRIQEVAPLLGYLTLAPLLGAARAYECATARAQPAASDSSRRRG